jgi:hypothetical protein
MLRISTFIFVLTCFISCKNASEKDKTSSSEKSTSNISEEEKN